MNDLEYIEARMNTAEKRVAELEQQLAQAQACCEATIGDASDQIVEGFARAKGWLSPDEAAKLQAQSKELELQIRSIDEEHDKEIGTFQDSVRNAVIERSGAPDSAIDGKGSDAGWQEFTLAEINQGFSFMEEGYNQKIQQWWSQLCFERTSDTRNDMESFMREQQIPMERPK